jgi:hypothetical protein
MAKTPTRLAGPAQLSGSAATKYTAPAGGALIRHIHVSNPSGSAVDLTLSIGADAAGTRLFDGYPIPADSVYPLHVYVPLGNAEIVQAWASSANVLVLTIGGDVLS